MDGCAWARMSEFPFSAPPRKDMGMQEWKIRLSMTPTCQCDKEPKCLDSQLPLLPGSPQSPVREPGHPGSLLYPASS